MDSFHQPGKFHGLQAKISKAEYPHSEVLFYIDGASPNMISPSGLDFLRLLRRTCRQNRFNLNNFMGYQAQKALEFMLISRPPIAFNNHIFGNNYYYIDR